MPAHQTSTLSETIDYLIKNSKKCFHEGNYAFAKSHLMTASSLDKDNFLIKIETYKMYKIENNFKHTSKYFADIFCNTKLWNQLEKNTKFLEQKDIMKNLFTEEMKNILYSISNEWKHSLSVQEFENFFNVMINTQFYRQLWNELKIEHRISCISRFCSYFQSKIELLIDLYLYILTEYPRYDVLKCAISLIELQKKLSNDSENKLPQYLREKYIIHILPVMFSSDSYYTTYGNKETILETHFINGLKYFIDDFLDDYKENKNLEKRNLLEMKLIEIVELIGGHKRWNIFKNDKIDLNCMQENIETISNYIHKSFGKDKALDLSVSCRKIAFYLIVLFVILFCRFVSQINNHIICEKLSGCNDNKLTMHLNLKKRKLMNYSPSLVAFDEELINNVNLLLKFNASILYLRKEFEDYICQIGLDKDQHYLQYKICNVLYDADYAEAIKILKNFKYIDLTNNFSNLLYWLQYYIQYLVFSIKLNLTKDAAIFIIKIIDLLFSSITTDSGNPTFAYQLTQNLIGKESNKLEKNNQSMNLNAREINYCSIELGNDYFNSRQMIFLCPTLENVIGLLVDASIILLSTITSDFTIGHMMVLSQYQWPYFYPTFYKSMQMVRGRTKQEKLPTFIYPLFSSYIFVPDIIEEFMALLNDYEFNLQLEPNSIIKNNQEISPLFLKLINKPENSLQTDLFIAFLIKEIKPFLASLFC